MRVLFLSQVLPYPLDAGPKMRSYFVLRHLAQNHEVTLLTFVRATDTPEAVAHLAEFCHAVHTVPMQRNRLRDTKFLVQSLFTGQPFLILRDHVPAMAAKIREMVRSEQFEMIHADQLWMAPYALIAQKVSPQARLVLDQHNAVYLIPRRLAEADSNPIKQRFLAREARRLMLFEPEICRHFDHVVWVTGEDRQAVNSLPAPSSNGYRPSTVIPICVNPTQIQPFERPQKSYRITFLGGLHWPPNAQGVLWFAKHVFPQVRAQIPEARLIIIGKNPPAGLTGEGIEVTGYVADPLPYLAEAGVFIVPLHAGGGMRVKILDAWSWGLPVVSTTVGAEGIKVHHEHNILQADTSEAFANAVVRIFSEPLLAQKLGQNGRKTVLEQYDWQAIYPAWDKVYESLTL
jgi:glycosyltransferase involved in cell wall biosynthesis